MFQLWMPLRNLSRNLRRTLLSLAIIALGTAMSYAVRGYVDDALFNIRNGVVEQTGNLQIASPLLWDNEREDFAYLLSPETVAAVTAILDRHPEVSSYTEQLGFSGLGLAGRKSKVLRVTALEPGNETLDYNDLVAEGAGLQPGDRGRMLIGRSLADELNVSPGGSVRVNLTTVDGAINLGTFTVAGVYELNDVQAEGQLAFIPLSFGQLLLNTPGLDKLIVRLDRLEDTDRLAEAVQAELDAAGLDLEVRTWVELSEFYQQISGFFVALFAFLTLAISVLVFFIVLQVLTMSFLERTREVGTIRAIGTRGRQVFWMFLAEGAYLGLLGGAAGLALGWLGGQGFNALGIGWTPPGAQDPVPVQLALGWGNALLPFAVSAVATLASAVYPSAHSARLKIVEALRTN